MTPPNSAAQYDVMQLEALFRIACRRRLSNSEANELAVISARVAERLRREITVPVPEFAPNLTAPRYW